MGRKENEAASRRIFLSLGGSPKDLRALDQIDKYNRAKQGVPLLLDDSPAPPGKKLNQNDKKILKESKEAFAKRQKKLGVHDG